MENLLIIKVIFGNIKNELYFQNGDYYLNEQQIREMKLNERDDWYYIT